MSNPIKDEFDKMSLANDIADREKIINKYQATGTLDRDDAIKKIVELRQKDAKVSAIYVTTVLPNSIPLEKCSNAVIIEHLQSQINVLTVELSEKENDFGGSHI